MLKNQNNSSLYIRRYLNELNQYFLFHRKSERQYLRHIKKQLKEYIEECPVDNYADFIHQFGSPQEVASTYYKNLDGDGLIKHLQIRKYLLRTCFFILILTLFLSIYSYVLLQKSIEYGEAIDIQHFVLPSIYHDMKTENGINETK